MKLNGFKILLLFSATQTSILIYVYVFYINSYSNSISCSHGLNHSASETTSELTHLFRQIGSSLKIDKITHGYQNLYGIYLGPIRHKPLNFLEIGLGCTMKYGAGKSLLAWRQFLTHPDTKISFVEFDQKCAEKFKPPVVSNLFVGDQSDFEFLKRVGNEAGPYDFIVDDGGHKRTFQVIMSTFI